MGKYAPLKSFLLEQHQDYIPMTFAQIERLLSFELPASKQYPAWWSNNPSNNTMTREWLDAGYETESVDIPGKKLVFRRARAALLTVDRESMPSRETGGEASLPQHPIFGCMKGTLTLLPDVDLTAPADPDWGKVYGG